MNDPFKVLEDMIEWFIMFKNKISNYLSDSTLTKDTTETVNLIAQHYSDMAYSLCPETVLLDELASRMKDGKKINVFRLIEQIEDNNLANDKDLHNFAKQFDGRKGSDITIDEVLGFISENECFNKIFDINAIKNEYTLAKDNVKFNSIKDCYSYFTNSEKQLDFQGFLDLSLVAKGANPQAQEIYHKIISQGTRKIDELALKELVKAGGDLMAMNIIQDLQDARVQDYIAGNRQIFEKRKMLGQVITYKRINGDEKTSTIRELSNESIDKLKLTEKNAMLETKYNIDEKLNGIPDKDIQANLNKTEFNIKESRNIIEATRDFQHQYYECSQLHEKMTIMGMAKEKFGDDLFKDVIMESIIFKDNDNADSKTEKVFMAAMATNLGVINVDKDLDNSNITLSQYVEEQVGTQVHYFDEFKKDCKTIDSIKTKKAIEKTSEILDFTDRINVALENGKLNEYSADRNIHHLVDDVKKLLDESSIYNTKATVVNHFNKNAKQTIFYELIKDALGQSPDINTEEGRQYWLERDVLADSIVDKLKNKNKINENAKDVIFQDNNDNQHEIQQDDELEL